MLRLFLLFCLSTLAASEQSWPNLKTTFGLNVFGSAFAAQPRTVDDAVAGGWQPIARCDGKFLGHRYADPADPSLVEINCIGMLDQNDFNPVIIYDDAGYIAGVQSVLLETDVDLDVNDLTKQPVYVRDSWMGEAAWFTTAYFVDPLVICNGGRSSSDWDTYGTGDRLLIQSGTPDNLISIPLTQAEADMTSDWYDHFCFVGMGDHYLQFDYTPEQACDSVLPFQILYDQGVITGFVWQHIGTLPGDKWEHPDANAVAAIIDRPPTCITDLLEYPGLSTMHHYFYNYPWLTMCPFNKVQEIRRF